MNKAIYGLLGLAQRAGKLAAGQEQALKAVQGGRAFLVILAEDASQNTKKVFNDKTAYYGIPLLEVDSRDGLGQALGKGPLAAVAVKDGSFARNIQKKMEEERAKS